MANPCTCGRTPATHLSMVEALADPRRGRAEACSRCGLTDRPRPAPVDTAKGKDE